MRKAYELVVVNDVLAESAAGHAHTAVEVTVEVCLGTVILLKVGDELLGSRGQTESLGLTLIILPSLILISKSPMR